MNAESYARRFLEDRGFDAGGLAGENCITKAAFVMTAGDGMRLKMSDLRAMAAMAQFSEREVGSHVLRFIESNGDVPGDVFVTMDATSIQIVRKEANA